MAQKAIGINDFLSKNFDVFEFEGEFLDFCGEPEKNFTMSVYGESGNGKTEFCVKLAKYLASFTSVLYASYEQGISKSLQDALKRNNMQEVAGKVMFIAKEPLKELIERLKRRGSARVVILDSLDYMRLTTDQFKILRETFPRKAFIVVSWAKNDKPKSQYARDIEFMSCVKVLVKQYKAYPRSRFGGNAEFVIWDKPTKKPKQQTLFS